MATVQVNLSSKLLAEINQNVSVKAYAVSFGGGGPNWTTLTAASNAVTLDGAGQKLYFIVQSNADSKNSVRTNINEEADISPVGAPTSADALNYRYDSFEVSLTPGSDDVGNLTDIVAFGIPMAISVGYGPSASTGATPVSGATRGYGINGGTVDASGSGSGLWKELYDIGGSNSIQFFSAVSGGYAITQPRLAITPATVIGNNVSGTNYSAGQWGGYTSSLYAGAGSQATSAGAAGQIQIAGYYTGGSDAAKIWHNGGYYAYDLTYNSATSSFVLTPGATSQIRGTITISQNDLNNSIYTTLGSATVGGFDNGFGVNSATQTMNTGYNNAWGTILRDFLAAFDAGYWNTSATSLNPALSGTVIDLNKEWNQDPTYAFGGLVSAGSAGAVTRTVAPLSGGIAYDSYSKVFFRETNSYGNGYSDYLGRSYSVGPLISVWDGVPVTPSRPAQDANWIDVTLFSDADTVGSALSGYTAPTIYNYLSGGYAAVTGVNSGGPLHQLDFGGAGTMTLKQDAEVALVLKSAGSGGADIRVALVAGGGTSGPFATSGTYGANYTITASGSGYAATYTGVNNAGFINIQDLPITSGSGVVWYQIEVGSGGVVSKIFNLYETVSSGQIRNPNYSGQAGALAIDGLAGVAGNGSGQFVAGNAGGGQVSVDFQHNIVNSIDPSLMTVVPLPSSASSSAPPIGGYLGPTAPVVGWRPGYTSGQQTVFREMYEVWSAQVTSTASSGAASWTVQDSIQQTVYNGGLVFGWNGADSVAQQQQYSLSTPNQYLNQYTNKIGGGNVAKLTFSGSALPSQIVANGGYLTVTADSEGTWQTVVPVQFANGTYSVQMQEFATSADASAGVRALNSASDAQSFTVSQGAAISTYNLSVDAVTSYGLIVASGGGVTVNSGGTTSATLVDAGGFEHVASGSDDGSFVASGGSHIVWAGQAATDLEVFSGGNSFIYGSSLSASLDKGASQYVIGQRGSGATSAVFTSAVESATTVFSGAYQYVYGLSASGAATVSGSGIASGTTVLGGGHQIVWSGGVALNASIGGYQFVSGGTASNTIVGSGGIQTILGGGTANAGSALSGGEVDVYSGGSFVGANIVGGTVHALSGGITSALTVQMGGLQKVWSGGIASNTTLNSGTEIDVYAGGSAMITTVQSNSVARIWGSGTVTSITVVQNGGSAYVFSGAVENDSNIQNGGDLWVWDSGSIVNNPNVSSGGRLVVHGNGIVSGTVNMNGGTLVMGNGALASATVVAAGSSLFTLHGSGAIGGGGLAISGFALGVGTFDFDDIGYTAGVTSAVWSSGTSTLQITSGALQATVSLFGSYATSNFQLGTDGHGTTVTWTNSATGSLSESLTPPHG